MYAIFFGFTYQAVNSRLSAIDQMLTEEAAHCLSILRLVLALPEQTTDRHIKLHMATAVKDALTTILNDVYDGGAEEQLAKDHDEKELKKQQLAAPESQGAARGCLGRARHRQERRP